MESAVNHPCQALADWKTMDDLAVPRRGKFVLSWANHPRALPLAVPAATVHMAAQRGMEVVVLRPEGLRAAGSDHGEGARGGRSVGRRRGRDRPIATRRSKARTSCTRRNGDRRRITATPKPRRRAARTARRLVRARELVRARARRLPFHALPAGAPQRRGRRRSARRSAQPRDPRRPPTAWSCRWPCSIVY